MGRAVGVKDQVLKVLLTTADPSRADPLKMRRVSPVASAAERDPEKVGVVSSVTAPLASVPWMAPTLSVTEEIAEEVLGGVVSRMKDRLADKVPRLPARSTTLAVSV